MIFSLRLMGLLSVFRASMGNLVRFKIKSKKLKKKRKASK